MRRFNYRRDVHILYLVQVTSYGRSGKQFQYARDCEAKIDSSTGHVEEYNTLFGAVGEGSYDNLQLHDI